LWTVPSCPIEFDSGSKKSGSWAFSLPIAYQSVGEKAYRHFLRSGAHSARASLSTLDTNEYSPRWWRSCLNGKGAGRSARICRVYKVWCLHVLLVPASRRRRPLLPSGCGGAYFSVVSTVHAEICMVWGRWTSNALRGSRPVSVWGLQRQ